MRTTVPARHDDRAPGQPLVPWHGVAAAAWRQHRTALLATSAAVLVLSLVAVLLGALGEPAPSPSTVQLTILLIDLYALSVGVFWAAPMIAREREQQTHLLAWSQDVSPLRWLGGKLLLLGTVAVVSALLLGASAQYLAEATPGTRDFAFSVPYFDASPVLQAGHTVFALLLGVTLGVLVRRSVPAMALTFVSFLAIRIVVAFAARPAFASPVEQVRPFGQAGGSQTVGALVVDVDWVTAAGDRVDLPVACASARDLGACLADNDVVGTSILYQPVERLTAFHLTETALFVGAALVLGAVTWSRLRLRRA